MVESVTCSCPDCKVPRWCTDGTRAVFERGTNECKRCGVVSWLHRKNAVDYYKRGR